MEHEAIEVLVRQTTQALARDPELHREAELLVRDRIAAGIQDREALAAEVAARYAPRLRARRIGRGLLTAALYAILPLCFIISALGFFSNAQPSEVTRYVAPYQSLFKYVTTRAIAPGLFADAREYQQRRKLWQAAPENRAYLNFYAESAIYNTLTANEAITLERDLRQYRQLDPENAHANYLLTHVQQTCALQEKIKSVGDFDIFDREYLDNRHIVLQDRQRFDRAMLLVKEGMRKPVWHNYTREIERARLPFFSPPYRLIDYHTRKDFVYERSYYYRCRHPQELVVLSSWYARLLVREGRAPEALPYLNLWRVYCGQMITDARDPYDILIGMSVAKPGANLAVEVYREMGREDLAQQALNDYTRFYTQYYGRPPVKPVNRRVPIQYDADTRTVSLPQRYGGVIAEEALLRFVKKPYISFPPQVFIPARNVGYLLSEELRLSIFLFFMVGVLGVLFIVQIFWGLAGLRQPTQPTLLLLPPARVWALILGVGVLLPLASYWWFTRYSGWAGRNLAVELRLDHFDRQTFTMLYLVVGIPFLIGWVWIRRRCTALQLPLSFASRPHIGRDLWSGLVSLIYIGLLLLMAYFSPNWWPDIQDTAALTLIAAVITFTITLLFPRSLLYRIMDASTAQYRATMARSLAAMLAVSMLLLMVIAVPTLLVQEHAWLQRDTVLVPKGNELYSPVYLQSFAVMKARVQRVTDGWVVE